MTPTSPFIESLVPALEEKLRAATPAGEPVLVQMAGDVVENLAFGTWGIVVTERRVLVVSGDDQEAALDLPLEEITAARLEGLVGGGRLVLERRGAAPIVLYLSHTLTSKFAPIADAIEQLRRGEAPSLPTVVERTRCARCGRLLPEKDGLCPACVGKRAILGRLLGYLRPYRRQAALLTGFLAAGTLAELVPPLLIQRIVDDVLVSRAGFGLLVVLALGLLGARLLQWLAEVVRGWLGAWLGARITADLRAELYRHLQHLPLRFFDGRPVGVLLTRLTKDVDRVEELLASAIPLLFVNVLMLIGVLTFLFATSWMLTLYVLLPVPFLLACGFGVWDPIRQAWERQATRWARLASHLHETLAGIRVVKVFTQEQWEAERFGRHNDDLFRAGVSAERRSFAFFTTLYFVMGLGMLGVWYVGGRQVVHNELTIGELLAVIAYLWMLYWPLQWFGNTSSSMAQALAGAGRVFEVLDQAPEPGGAEVPDGPGGVTFRSVSFGYDPGQPVLKDVDLAIAPGEMVGLVGRSGSGKTTMVSLLCRFRDPDQGAIEFDGADLRGLSPQAVRGRLGLVPQDPLLFSGTLAENIAYGKPAATFDQIVTAARAAGAHAFIAARPDGYDSQAGERGCLLSGGERQRVALARALLRNPRVLVLDEATSSLDGPSEQHVHAAVRNLAAGRTVLVVAHRLAAIRHADRLVVLDRGRVVETGTYDELMAQLGVFHELAMAQLKPAPAEGES